MENINKTNFKTKSFNLFWKFLKLPIDANLEDVFTQIHLFKRISLPHDWLIYSVNELYETSSGWYLKEINIKKDNDRVYKLYFEGVYHNSTLYVNRKEVGSWKNGYTSFEMDITNYLIDGENIIIMQVRHQHPNSRWYSGAGIYRNVWWLEKQKTHVKTHGTYISTSPHGEDWTVQIETDIVTNQSYMIKQTLYHDHQIIGQDVYQGDSQKAIQFIEVEQPFLWSVTHPFLYMLETQLFVNEVLVDERRQKVGFKHIQMNADKGLFLNGKHMKLNGVCEHHDLGSLGVAFSNVLLRKRLHLLKNMGVNAIRSAHSVPSPDLMDLADELGFLIVSEAFDIWEKPKNPYDYARFFDIWVDKDVESWITRDRNHVSLLMWSIGNEIQDANADTHGLEITNRLVDLVDKYDPHHHAAITFGSNFLMGENTRKCADVFKVVGYNYGESMYESHHKLYPDWKIYGSETSSILQSRGIYHFPLNTPILADEDCQCSALGNSSPSWGAKSIEKILTYDRDLPFSMGQFIWTGFDYLGEPTPYETINSYFGQLDTAGFKKDSYYIYQAAWTDGQKRPMIHIFPYWQFNDGEIIDVRVCTNVHRFKLFLNDMLIGEKTIDMTKDEELVPTWQIPYQKGILKAIGYDVNGQEVAHAVKSSFGDPASFKITMDKKILKADGMDLVEITVETVDENKNIVENSNLPIKIEVDGPGKIIGIDNGDSSDYQPYKGCVKQMFSGKLKIFVGSTYETGNISITVHSPIIGMEIFNLISRDYSTDDEEILLAKKEHYDIRTGEVFEYQDESILDNVPIQGISLKTKLPRIVTKLKDTVDIKADIHPAKASKQALIWKVVSEKGIEIDLAELTPYEGGCKVKAKGDGHFIVRCMAKNNKNHPDIISTLAFEAKGIGVLNKDPYAYTIAGLYDDAIGEIKSGQEQGVAFNTIADTAIYEHIDFGKQGSNRVTLSIFAFESSPLEISIYDGDPRDEKTTLIDTLTYHKETIWNVYQDETYMLSKRLTGIHTLAFKINKVAHFKGFVFEKQNRAYEQIDVLSCDEYYGDSLTKNSWGFSSIGNNVSFKFEDMIFNGLSAIEINGYSHTEKNSIRVQLQKTNGDAYVEMIEFPHDKGFVTKRFTMKDFKGQADVSFIFLPGSQFDFKWFKFIK